MSPLGIVGSCVGVYAILAVGYHVFLQPVANSYPNINKPAPETAAEQLARSAGPAERLYPVPPKHVSANKQAPSNTVSPAPAPARVTQSAEPAAPKKPQRQQSARNTERRERVVRDAGSPLERFFGIRF